MSDVKTTIPVGDFSAQTGYTIADDGDGVLGPTDVVTDPSGQPVDHTQAARDYWVGKAISDIAAANGGPSTTGAPQGLASPISRALIQHHVARLEQEIGHWVDPGRHLIPYSLIL